MAALSSATAPHFPLLCLYVYSGHSFHSPALQCVALSQKLDVGLSFSPSFFPRSFASLSVCPAGLQSTAVEGFVHVPRPNPSADSGATSQDFSTASVPFVVPVDVKINIIGLIIYLSPVHVILLLLHGDL